ncbi:MAG: RagB/SusD family nutrient uptake outer membrane protein, partial [Tannerella sp.]|nr:RagB/SusD family nutrient uptake outer membrane protein [Tannerella sp.]
MKNIIIISILMTGTLLSSCSDSLDGVEQLGALEMEKFYASAADADAEALITSVYNSSWDTWDNGDINYMEGVRGLTDELLSTGTDVYAGASTETATMENFTGLYSINYKCNLIIENLADNSEVKSRVIGEAYFWR